MNDETDIPAEGDSGAAAVERLWALWREVAKAFGIHRVIGALLLSPTFFGIYGADLASSLRRTRMARRAMRVLEQASDAELEALAGISAVNVARNDAMWRLAAILYISIPVTLGLGALQVAPAFIAEVMREVPLWAWLWAGMMTAFVIYYFITQWRARQIAAIIDLARVERTFSQAGEAPDQRSAASSATPV